MSPRASPPCPQKKSRSASPPISARSTPCRRCTWSRPSCRPARARPGPHQHPDGNPARRADLQQRQAGRGLDVQGSPHGQGSGRGRGIRPGGGDLRLGAAQPRRAHQPGAAEDRRRLHLHALRGRVRADGGVGPPDRAERGPGAHRRPGRAAARSRQGRHPPGRAQQAGQAHRRGIRASQVPPRGRLEDAAPRQWRGACRAGRLPAPPREDRWHGLPRPPGQRQAQHHRAHGRHLRCVRRHHLQPPLQEWLGSGRIHPPHGRVDTRAPGLAAVPGLREKPGHLPHWLAGAPRIWAPGRGGRAEPGHPGVAAGQGVLLHQVRPAHPARNRGPGRPPLQRPHRRA